MYLNSENILFIDDESNIHNVNDNMRWIWNHMLGDRNYWSEDTMCYWTEGDPNILLKSVSASSPNFLHSAICL